MQGPIAIDRQATLHFNLRDDGMEVVVMTLLEALKPATFGCGFCRCLGLCHDEPKLMLFGKLIRVVGPKIDEPE